MKCPTCGRELSVKKNRFGDPVWPRHKMARLADLDTRTGNPKHISDELAYKASNPDAYALWQIDCPNSGQPV